MANLNKVFLIGRLTRDPEMRYTPSGAAVAEFGFAVNRYYIVNGERREDTCFLDVSAWGRLGETVRNYLRKGRQAFIEGHLTYSEWQTQDGQKRSKIRVVADTVQFLDPANRNAAQDAAGPEEFGSLRSSPPPPAGQAPAQDVEFPETGGQENGDEVPF